ncbi:MAG TPA: nucleotidyl transferase AbiEii/AbiGii toxin family protein [Nitrospira sp.]|nr:nucleotidyl transferase AbiEii/AbiGii toxin family protein [Nitrospira sp.]
MPKLPLLKLEAATRLSNIARMLGHSIFLSGGAAAWMQGSQRAVKDLDFRITLPFNWLSASGRSLMSDFNEHMRRADRKAEFRVNDVRTGYTILGEFFGVEVSISNSTLPHNVSLENNSVSLDVSLENNSVSPDAWLDLSPQTHSSNLLFLLKIISLDDNIFDKMLSLMFRYKPEKQKTDLIDLCTLLILTDNPPSYFVHRFFIRRGAAYAFNSKPAEIERHLHKRLNDKMLALDVRNKLIEEAGLRKLVEDPELLMLTEFHTKLSKGLEKPSLIALSKLSSSLQVAFKKLLDAAAFAIKNKPPMVSLAKVTPQGVEVRSRSITDSKPGVVAKRTKGGSWEV